MGNSLNFREALPEMPANATCPPSDANRPERQTVIRLVAAAPPKSDDFCSYHTLGKPKPIDVDPCRWASCSVFTTKPALAKLPRIRKRFKFIAELEIDEDSGVVKAGHGGHLDLWMFSDFDPLQAIVACSPL